MTSMIYCTAAVQMRDCRDAVSKLSVRG